MATAAAEKNDNVIAITRDNGASRPDYRRAEYKQQMPNRQMCRDLMADSRAIHDGGEVYLPKNPGEESKDYKVRARLTEVFRGFQRTVQAAIGMIFATPPTLDEEADAVLKDDWEDIDGRGTHGEVFAKEVETDAIVDGFSAILVDHPPMPEGMREDQRIALGLRPFWVRITASQLISWIIEKPDWPTLIRAYLAGLLSADIVKLFARQAIVRQVVIWEPTDTTDGAYGIRTVDRYRVIRLEDGDGVVFRVWEKRKSAQGQEYFQMVDSGVMEGAPRTPSGPRVPLPAIPLAVNYAGRKMADFVADSPVLALAELNIGHYRVSADRRYLMKVCHAPTLAIMGVQAEVDDDTGRPKKREYKIGVNHVLDLPGQNAKAEWISADPAALTSSKEEKDDLVKQMAAVGMSFLAKDRTGGNETAEGRRLDDAAENSTHATAARGLQDCLEQAWMFHACYRGVEAPEIAVNTSYASAQMDPQVLNLLWQAVMNDRLDMETFLHALQFGKLPDNFKADEAVLQALLDAKAKADATDDGGKTDQPPKQDEPQPPAKRSLQIRNAKGELTHSVSET
jgi:hypothetical protein